VAPVAHRTEPQPEDDRDLPRRRRGGNIALAGDLRELAGLEAAHGREPLLAALERAVAFGRYRAQHVRSIFAAGPPRPASPPLVDAQRLPQFGDTTEIPFDAAASARRSS
jgi:hypothetical protein